MARGDVLKPVDAPSLFVEEGASLDSVAAKLIQASKAIEDGPSAEVEEFAAWFDLGCEANGLTATVLTVRDALDMPRTTRAAA